ncbi:hypothetical protein QA601_09080 [Chitinispirillales bacterium ANBcel5]|nr:hypothetical protein [Chitinispirillales bacterium ANBcel5]
MKLKSKGRVRNYGQTIRAANQKRWDMVNAVMKLTTTEVHSVERLEVTC